MRPLRWNTTAPHITRPIARGTVTPSGATRLGRRVLQLSRCARRRFSMGAIWTTLPVRLQGILACRCAISLILPCLFDAPFSAGVCLLDWGQGPMERQAERVGAETSGFFRVRKAGWPRVCAGKRAAPVRVANTGLILRFAARTISIQWPMARITSNLSGAARKVPILAGMARRTSILEDAARRMSILTSLARRASILTDSRSRR